MAIFIRHICGERKNYLGLRWIRVKLTNEQSSDAIFESTMPLFKSAYRTFCSLKSNYYNIQSNSVIANSVITNTQL